MIGYSMSALAGGKDLAEEGVHPHQLVGWNAEIVHHELDLISDGPAQDHSEVERLARERRLLAGNGAERAWGVP